MGLPGYLPLELLKKSLLQALASCSEHMLILLDGLDEYEGRKVELTNFIKALQLKNIKICTASRPDPPFPDAFASMPTFLMQELNFEAIQSFSSDVLEQFYSAQQFEPAAIKSLAKDIAQRSQGVCLWARFAVNELIEGLSRGEKLGSYDLEQRLAELPEELQQIYSRIFQRFTPAHKKTAALFLLLICYKLKEINLGMLENALCYVPTSWGMSDTNQTNQLLGNDSRSFSKQLLAITGGVVEVLQVQAEFLTEYGSILVFDCELPRLIHRTVETYLEFDGWRELLGNIFTPELGHEIWIQVCANAIRQDGSNLASRIPYLRKQFDIHEGPLAIPIGQGSSATGQGIGMSAESSSSQIIQSEPPTSETFLLGYAISCVLDHASAYETCSICSCREFVEHCLTPAFIEAHLELIDGCSCGLLRSIAEDYDTQIEPFSLACSHRLVHYTTELVQETSQSIEADHKSNIVDRIFKSFRRGSSDDFTRRLRVRKAQVIFCACGPDRSHGTDWAPILTPLLNYGATIADHDLFSAVAYGPPQMLKLLLSGRSRLNVGNLEPKFLRYVHWRNLDLATEFFREKSLTLVAGLGLRLNMWSENEMDAREIIHILEERGARISQKCGALGGVIHYVVACVATGRPIYFHNDEYYTAQLALLIDAGANINENGRLGKPLELTWELANSCEFEGMGDIPPLRRMIRALLSNGAVNERKDPNGLVPSRIQMQLFGCNWTDYLECRRYYQEGPSDRSRPWPGPIPSIPEVPRFTLYEIDYEEARKEYREAMGLDTPQATASTRSSLSQESGSPS